MIRLEKMRPFRQLGRRGLFLTLFGLLWVCVGVSVLVSSMSTWFSGTGPPLPVVSLLEHPVSGLLWVVAGLASGVSAAIRRRRRGHDGAGFNALLVPPFLWLMGYVWSQAAWIVTGTYGRSTAWIAICVWVIICASVILAAGWPDPDDPAVRAREGK